ncbi:MAG TPA: glycosyltransferase family 4 protein [Bacillota bacterium]|nr:glycosyltransferase family 4 protein [Bacillota bacterium]
MNNTPQKRKKVLMIGNSHLVIFKFRKELVQRLVPEGYEVWVSFPNGPFGEGNNSSKEFGCNFIETHINRRGKNPFQDISLFFQYFSIIRKIRPDVVLAYTVKPDVYGGIVCRLLHIPFMPNITGLGKGLDEGGVIQKISVLLYKIAVRRAKCVFFQNRNDREFFLDNHIKFEKDCLLPGSGVNLSEFNPLPYPTDDKIKFIFLARVMKAKGIEQFFDAAEYIKKDYPNTEFHICGYCEEDYIEKIEKYQTTGTVIYHGLVNNVTDFVRASHCIVLPTFHPEGISNVLLEGAACARPLITTNRPGCREAVADGVSGFLVKERDSQDLIEKMVKFLQLSLDEKKEMGESGRRKIESEFNREIVVESYLSEIEKL